MVNSVPCYDIYNIGQESPYEMILTCPLQAYSSKNKMPFNYLFLLNAIGYSPCQNWVSQHLNCCSLTWKVHACAILNISGCHQNIEHNLKHLLILGLPQLSIADDTSSSVKPFWSKLSVFSITPNSASAFPWKKNAILVYNFWH